VFVFSRVHVGTQLVGGGPEGSFDVVEHGVLLVRHSRALRDCATERGLGLLRVTGLILFHF
jgi:hypothetical protein